MNQPKSTVELCYMCPRGLSGPPAVTLTKKLKIRDFLLDEITQFLLASPCFGIMFASNFNIFLYSVWLRITDEGSIPEVRIWSMMLIQPDFKLILEEVSFCISTSWRVHYWWTRSPEGTCSKVLRSTSVYS